MGRAVGVDIRDEMRGLLVVLVLAGIGCGDALGSNPDWAELGRPHIVLVVADTLRADHAGPWGGGFDRSFEVYRTLFPPGNHAAARATARHHCSTGAEKRPVARRTD